MQEIIKKAEKWALKEISQHHSPPLECFKVANEKGQELASKFNVNKEIVMLGTVLMDIELGRCISEGKAKEHVARSVDSARNFLVEEGVKEEIIEKIVNCIECHHGTKVVKCKEAEVCLNADCYKFLTFRGVSGCFLDLGARGESYEDSLALVRNKIEEKWNCLTLDYSKEELKEDYEVLKEKI